MTPSSVLVYVGVDLVGDGLMKLPFVRALRAACPDAHITWCAGNGKSVYANALQPLIAGYIDEVIEEAGIGQRPAELLQARPLGGRRFDLIIDTQRRTAPALCVRRVAHERFVSAAAGWFLSDKRPKRGDPKPKAMVAQMIHLLELALEKPISVTPKPLAFEPGIHAAAKALLPSGAHPVALAPGAGGKHKCWPLSAYTDLANGLRADGATPVFILGPQEASWAAELTAAGQRVCQPGSVFETIALAQLCEVGVSNDCGTGHMFAAADLPMVSLFGPTSPDKFKPATDPLVVVNACDFGEGREMSNIPVAPVHRAVRSLLI